MCRKASTNILAGMIVSAIVLSFSAPAFAQDAAAAKSMARKSSCLRCHAVGKKKEGPSYQTIAYEYKGRGDAADVLVKHITTGEDRVKLTDGHVELHKDIMGKESPESIRNLVAWILAQ